MLAATVEKFSFWMTLTKNITVYVEDVAWVEFEHYPGQPKGKAKRFRLAPQKFTANITFNFVEGLTTNSNFTVGNATVTQIEWDYRCANWVYTVLSRVRTRKGLFLTKPLDLDREFNVPESLIDFERRIRIRANLEQPTLDRLAQKGHYCSGRACDTAQNKSMQHRHDMINDSSAT